MERLDMITLNVYVDTTVGVPYFINLVQPSGGDVSHNRNTEHHKPNEMSSKDLLVN